MHQIERILGSTVHFVNKGKNRNATHLTYMEQFQGLCLHTFCAVDEHHSRIICVPEGYANCLKASIADSVLLVYSGKRYEEALADSWRYDKDMWVDWSKY